MKEKIRRKFTMLIIILIMATAIFMLGSAACDTGKALATTHNNQLEQILNEAGL